jgi:hypothetical protein
MIPNPGDQFGAASAGMAAGHQPNWVAALMVSGMAARVRQRSLNAASRSLRVAKCLFATASFARGQRCSAGWHVSGDLVVPPGIELAFLPPYTPELQPAEHLWPLDAVTGLRRW